MGVLRAVYTGELNKTASTPNTSINFCCQTKRKTAHLGLLRGEGAVGRLLRAILALMGGAEMSRLRPALRAPQSPSATGPSAPAKGPPGPDGLGAVGVPGQWRPGRSESDVLTGGKSGDTGHSPLLSGDDAALSPMRLGQRREPGTCLLRSLIGRLCCPDGLGSGNGALTAHVGGPPAPAPDLP